MTAIARFEQSAKTASKIVKKLQKKYDHFVDPQEVSYINDLAQAKLERGWAMDHVLEYLSLFEEVNPFSVGYKAASARQRIEEWVESGQYA